MDNLGRLRMAAENAARAIEGKDISDIWHSAGGVSLAKRVVSLKAAVQNLCSELRVNPERISTAMVDAEGGET